MDLLGVVVVVTDRQVLAGLEQEVATPQADDDRSLDARRPHDRAAEDLPEVVEDDEPAVLGGLDDAGVAVGPERQAVRAADAVRQQRLYRLRHPAGVVGVGRAELERLVGGRLGDPGDAGVGPPVEDGDVLGQGDPAGRLVETAPARCRPHRGRRRAAPPGPPRTRPAARRAAAPCAAGPADRRRTPSPSSSGPGWWRSTASRGGRRNRRACERPGPGRAAHGPRRPVPASPPR